MALITRSVRNQAGRRPGNFAAAFVLPAAVVATLCSGPHRLQAQVRADTAETKPPSSYKLISLAVEAGKIDAETAHKYRVFAAFGYRGLPAEFRETTAASPNPQPSWKR